jgi:hypothetical protein
MKTNLILSLLMISFGCSNNRIDESFLSKFKTKSKFTYKSNRDYSKYSGNRIDSLTIQNYFSNTDITKNNGDHYSGLNFQIHPIFKTTNGMNIFLILAKEIDMIDGDLTEYYLVKVKEGKVISILEIGNDEAVAECATDFELETKNNKLKAISREVCYNYDDEKDKEYDNIIINSKIISLDENFEVKSDKKELLKEIK